MIASIVSSTLSLYMRLFRREKIPRDKAAREHSNFNIECLVRKMIIHDIYILQGITYRGWIQRGSS